MNTAALAALLFMQLFIGGAFAAGQAENVQPFVDSDWKNAKCRFRVLTPDGAYGNHITTTLEGCVSSAEIGLMYFANKEKDETPFHAPAELEFFDESGARHVCRLEAKKDHFDRLPNLSDEVVTRRGFYDAISAEFKRLLGENFSVVCR